MTVSGHFQATVVLIPGKELWYPLCRRLCGSQKLAGHGEGKIHCPLSVPSNYSPRLSILHWYELLELYNVIYSAAPHSRIHTRMQYVPRGVQNFRFFMYGYIWVIKYYRNITPYYQTLRRYEHFNIRMAATEKFIYNTFCHIAIYSYMHTAYTILYDLMKRILLCCRGWDCHIEAILCWSFFRCRRSGYIRSIMTRKKGTVRGNVRQTPRALTATVTLRGVLIGVTATDRATADCGLHWSGGNAGVLASNPVSQHCPGSMR